jgi:4-aminobutyrate aminotransferase
VTTARAAIADSMRYLTLSTFGGNPVSTAAAKAVIEFIQQQDLLTNCEQVGGYLRERLLELQAKYSLIGDVRGKGLLQAMELVKDRETKEPAAEEMLALMEAARRNRLLIGKGGLYGNVIRITPPMNISRGDVEECIRLLDLSFGEVARQHS